MMSRMSASVTWDQEVIAGFWSHPHKSILSGIHGGSTIRYGCFTRLDFARSTEALSERIWGSRWATHLVPSWAPLKSLPTWSSAVTLPESEWLWMRTSVDPCHCFTTLTLVTDALNHFHIFMVGSSIIWRLTLSPAWVLRVQGTPITNILV